MPDQTTSTRRNRIKTGSVEITNTYANQMQPPVQVTTTVKKVKERRRFSMQGLLSTIILFLSLLCCLLFVGVILAGLGWMQTWRTFTQETEVAEITISEVKKHDDGKPYFNITYTPKNDVSALSFLTGNTKSNDKVVEAEIPGDEFIIESDHFKWSDWITFVGVKPMYKTFRITGLYKDTSQYIDPSYPKKAVEINGGQDKTWEYFNNNSKTFNFLGTAYLSNPGQYATNKSRTFELKATEDALILKEK
jgi:hypothetical protein